MYFTYSVFYAEYMKFINCAAYHWCERCDDDDDIDEKYKIRVLKNAMIWCCWHFKSATTTISMKSQWKKNEKTMAFNKYRWNGKMICLLVTACKHEQRNNWMKCRIWNLSKQKRWLWWLDLCLFSIIIDEKWK